MGEPERNAGHRIVVICSECGEVIECNDVEALLLSLHIQNACEPMTRVVGVSY